MKKSLFIALLMAAACPSALANDGGTTRVEGYTASDPASATGPTTFYGAYEEAEAAVRAEVYLLYSEEGEPYSVNNVYGGWSALQATGNTVIARDGAEAGTLIGGYGHGTPGLVAASGNFVYASYTRVGSAVCGGAGDYGDVKGNTVILDHVTGNNPLVYGGMSSAGEACDNTVIVAGGELDDVVAGVGSAGSIDNHVILVGKGPHIDIEAPGQAQPVRIYGDTMQLGYVAGYMGVVPGNSATLDIYGTGVTATNIQNFTTLNFDLCPCLEPGMTIVTLDGGEITDLEDVVINLTPQGRSTQLEKGSVVTLIRTNGSITGLDEQDVTFSTTEFFSTFKGTVAVEDDDKALVLHVTDIRESSGTPAGDVVKSVLETRAQATAMVNGGADFMMSNGIWHARHAAQDADRQDRSATAPFLAVGGSFMRHNTGSHIKSHGLNLATGVSGMVDGHALAAAFEYGDSSYDSYVNDIHANGKGRSWGAALLGDWYLGAGWHMDTVGRVGKVRTTYNANLDGPVDYRNSSTYAGASIGFGNVQKAGVNGEFDTYLRYLYTRINGGNARLNTGDSARFRSVNASRTVLGTRYLYAVAENSRVYAGAGWMQQFGGGSHGSVDGVTGPSPSLKGASGFFELGTQLAYPDNRNLGFDFNVTGWVGTQRGVSVGAGVRYAF